MNRIIETLMSRTRQEFLCLARGKYGPVTLDPGIVQNVLRERKKAVGDGISIRAGSQVEIGQCCGQFNRGRVPALRVGANPIVKKGPCCTHFP